MTTIVQYTADGTQAAFTVPFAYLEQPHVVVRVNGVLATNGAHYDFSGPSTVTFRTQFKPSANALVELRRETPSASLVTYQNAAVLTAADLNTAVLQSLYISEEIRDYYESKLNGGLSRLTNGTYVDVQAALDAAAQEVLNSSLLADLQARISDIDTNAESIATTNLELIDVQAQLDALDSTNGGTAALVIAEEAARVAGDTAIAEKFALIGAVSGDNLSFILDLNKVKVSPSESLATRLSTIASTDAANSAAISSEQITRANADSALSSSITTLNSTVAGQSASISTLQTTTNGIAAQYMVKLDVNGYVSGFGLYNAAGSSQFTVLADKFAVVTPGGSPKVPFSISGGVVYMQNVVIGGALIDSLTVNKLTAGTLTATVTQNADWNVGTGKIIWDNGTYMKVSGVGFGSSNQFIEWFGPKMSITSCTEANAISYLTTSGGAYFGGTLSAGILSNTGQTTDTSATAEITVGAFSTNGGTKTITLSYNYAYTYKCATGTGALTGSTGAATILLERSIGGGAWTTIATLNATQTQREVIVDGEPGIQDIVQFRIGGSTTVTDNSGATSDMRLRGRITSRTLATYGGTSKTNIVNTQNVSVISNE